MAPLVRQAAGLLRVASSSSRQAGQQLQQRRSMGAHDLEVKHNKYVEEWLSRREDFEREFSWTGKNLAYVLTFGLALPIATYNMLVGRFQSDDDYAERPRRDFLWGHAKPGPANLVAPAKP